MGSKILGGLLRKLLRFHTNGIMHEVAFVFSFFSLAGIKDIVACVSTSLPFRTEYFIGWIEHVLFIHPSVTTHLIFPPFRAMINNAAMNVCTHCHVHIFSLLLSRYPVPEASHILRACVRNTGSH